MQVHLLPRELPRRFLCLGSVGGKLVAHLHQTCHIHLGADLFHAMQDLRDRKLNGFEETELFALIQHTGQIFGQKPHDCGAGEYQLVVLGIVFPRLVEVQGPLCRGFGLCFDVQIKEMGRSLFQRVRVEIRVGKISGELGVEQWFRKFHADAAQQMRMLFVTVHDHGMVIAVEQPLQALHHIRTEYVDANGFAVHGDHQCRKRGFSGFARAFGVKRPGLFHLVRATGRRIDFEAEFRNVVGGAFMAFVQMFLHHGEMVLDPCLHHMRIVDVFDMWQPELAGFVHVPGWFVRIERFEHAILGPNTEFELGE